MPNQLTTREDKYKIITNRPTLSAYARCKKTIILKEQQKELLKLCPFSKTLSNQRKSASGTLIGFASWRPIGAIIRGVIGYFGGKKSMMSIEDDHDMSQWYRFKCPNCDYECKEKIQTNIFLYGQIFRIFFRWHSNNDGEKSKREKRL